MNLQNIYQAKAEADFVVMERRVRGILKKNGRDSNSIPRTTIKSFCKNARKLKVSVMSNRLEIANNESIRKMASLNLFCDQFS